MTEEIEQIQELLKKKFREHIEQSSKTLTIFGTDIRDIEDPEALRGAVVVASQHYESIISLLESEIRMNKMFSEAKLKTT